MAKTSRAEESRKIKKALAAMAIGETRTVRIGPGPEGRILLKKRKSGSPPNFVNPNVQRRAKVIGRKRI